MIVHLQRSFLTIPKSGLATTTLLYSSRHLVRILLHAILPTTPLTLIVLLHYRSELAHTGSTKRSVNAPLYLPT